MKKEMTKKPVVKKEVTVVTTTTTTETVKVEPKKVVEPTKKEEQIVEKQVVKAEPQKEEVKTPSVPTTPAAAKPAAPAKAFTPSAVTTEKKAVIVYAHPYNGSYAAATLEAAKKGLEAKGKKYDVIDLHAEGYDPIYHGRELAQYSKGIVVCDKSKKYAQMIKEADELVFIYPTWWGGMPAILKGFVDKVFLSGDGFWETLKPRGVFPFLWGRSTWIKRVSIFTTSFTPNQVSAMMLGNISKHNAKYAFKAMRMRNVRVYNIDRVATRSRANKERHLLEVSRRCAKELYR